jgi:hypothetical protein
MPSVRPNRTAGGRPPVQLLGGSARSTERDPALTKSARRAKRKLIREARALAGSTDWDAGARQLAVLRRRWSRVGSAGAEYEQKLRKRFEVACEEFERRRAQHSADRSYPTPTDERRRSQPTSGNSEKKFWPPPG